MKKAISAVIAASLMLAGCSKEEVSYDPNVCMNMRFLPVTIPL